MASKATKVHMERLKEQRNQLIAEMEALKNKIAGLEMAMSLLNDDAIPVGGEQQRSRRTNVKETILDLLEESGTTGLNAATAVEIARRRGVELDRGSVSSLLSRFKRDDLVVYENDRYRLKKFAKISTPTLASGAGGVFN